VKLSALSSLTHLVLGGMVKAKGNVAKVAMLLVDDDQGKSGGLRVLWCTDVLCMDVLCAVELRPVV
jgi:hypothetical protein